MSSKPNALFIIAGDFNHPERPIEFLNDLTGEGNTFKRMIL